MIKFSLYPLLLLLLPLLISGCTGENSDKKFSGKPGEVQLMILDPGHFHAGLVQKTMYDQVSPIVHVFAPAGAEVDDYLRRVEQYNTRPEGATHWQEKLHISPDYLEQMIRQKPGNVMIIAGNNAKKTEYLKAAVAAGIHVLADKPMAIDLDDFELLKQCFIEAEKNNVLLYDIMTERSEITSLLQKEIAQIPEVFGALTTGSATDPAITKESVHHFFKEVSGKPLIRPAWFYDVAQQGDGIVDVTTHLLDLVMWAAYPDQPINYKTDIAIISAKRWATILNQVQFSRSTGTSDWPAYLQPYLDDQGLLQVYANGEIHYRLKDTYAKVSVIWNYEAPAGTGDTHYSVMKGTKAWAVIQQGKEENYRPELYVLPAGSADASELTAELQKALVSLQEKYPGIGLEPGEKRIKITIPDKYRIGHEAHFGQVVERYLGYLKSGRLPAWETPNMLAKYWTTAQALKMAKGE